MKNFKSLLGFLLSLTLILDSFGMHAFASQLTEEFVLIESEELTAPDSSTRDGEDMVSGGDVSAPDATAGDVTGSDITTGDVSAPDVTTGDISVGDVTAGDVSEGNISSGDVSGADISAGDAYIDGISVGDASINASYIDQGTHKGMDWILTKSGHLIISGTYDPHSLEPVDYPDWLYSKEDIITAKVTAKNVQNMTQWFYGCTNLKSVDMKGVDTSKVTSIREMFCGCWSLTSLDVSKWNTENITNYSYAFFGCHSLKKLDTSGWRAAETVNMYSCFDECGLIQELDFSNFSPKTVTSMSYMADSCVSLTSVDLSGFQNAEIKECISIFKECRSLCYLDMSPFNLEHATNNKYNSYGFIEDCMLLEVFKTPRNVVGECYLSNNFVDEEGNLYRYIPEGLDYSLTLTAVGHEISDIEPELYTGKAVKPTVVVSKGIWPLEEGVDYTVSYKNNVNAASADAKNAPTVIVKGKGAYKGTIKKTFTIEAIDLSKAKVSEVVLKTNGKKQIFKSTVTLNGKKLKPGKDYQIDYSDTSSGAYIEAGEYEVAINGIGNYQGSAKGTMELVDGEVVKASKLKIGSIPSFEYDEEKPANPQPTVTYKGKELVLGEDYSISYKNNSGSGKATVVIKGLRNTKGTYVLGTVEKSFTIKGVSIKKAKVNFENTATYTGSAICPQVTVYLGTEQLDPKDDYSVEYRNNTDAGKATLEIVGKKKYNGSIKKTFTIKPLTLTEEDVTIKSIKAASGYTGKAVSCNMSIVRKDTGKTLKQGSDFTVSYKNNINATQPDKLAIATAKGKGNYRFTVTGTFTIAPYSIAPSPYQSSFIKKEDIAITVPDVFVGQSKSMLSEPVLKNPAGKKLKKNKDYIITGYTANGKTVEKNSSLDPGTQVVVTVEGIGNYQDKITATYRVAEKNIAKTKVTVVPRVYELGDGYGLNGDYGRVVVIDSKTKKRLVYRTDYTYTFVTNKKNPARSTLIIKGVGDYGGEKRVNVKIIPRELY